jgi:uridine kinase
MNANGSARRTRLIGVAGCSGAGKSEVARALADWLPAPCPVVTLDSYYFALDHLSWEERAAMNFDHPDSLDWPLIREHVAALARGETIAEPVYLFAQHTRAAEPRVVTPGEFAIVEGLFTLHDAAVRAQWELSIFVATPDEVCFERRKRRDQLERGRDVASIERQYAATVRPMAEQFVRPSARYADVILSGDNPLDAVLTRVRECTAQRLGLSLLPGQSRTEPPSADGAHRH